MSIGYRRRLADFAGGLRLSREFARRERQPRESLDRYQGERLESVVRHAAAHSPFYRERLAGVVDRDPVELSRLPVLDKSEMMERFDELVTDGRLRRDALLGWVEGLDRDELYLDRYRVMTTSGSSGRKGLFVFDRSEWRIMIAQFLRYVAMVGVRPRLPRRLRIAAVVAPPPHT
jgi:phenylacetate-CoA ligase